MSVIYDIRYLTYLFSLSHTLLSFTKYCLHIYTMELESQGTVEGEKGKKREIKTYYQ
jgi:hypothetical protein